MKFNNAYYSNTFFPFCVNKWNSLNNAIRSSESINVFKKSLLQFIRPSRSAIYNVHDPIGLKYLTRLRLQLSHLREHKFRHNFQDTLNPLCSCNLFESESVNHFLLLCPIYINQRKTLLDNLSKLDAGITNLSNANLVKLLLYGNQHLYSNAINASILELTILYLKTTERFDDPLF